VRILEFSASKTSSVRSGGAALYLHKLFDLCVRVCYDSATIHFYFSETTWFARNACLQVSKFCFVSARFSRRNERLLIRSLTDCRILVGLDDLSSMVDRNDGWNMANSTCNLAGELPSLFSVS